MTLVRLWVRYGQPTERADVQAILPRLEDHQVGSSKQVSGSVTRKRRFNQSKSGLAMGHQGHSREAEGG